MPMRKQDAPLRRRTSACRSATACCMRDGAAHRVDHGGELDEGTVAHRLDDAAAMLGDERVDDLAPRSRTAASVPASSASMRRE